MSRLQIKSIALLLAVAVLLMLGATTGSAFAHEIQHAAHHTPGMHKSGVCAWMCAASGAITTAAVHAATVTLNEDRALPVLFDPSSSEFFSQLQARAPPILL